MPVATSIPSLIQKTIDDLLVQHTPKLLEGAGIQVPSLTWCLCNFAPRTRWLEEPSTTYAL